MKSKFKIKRFVPIALSFVMVFTLSACSSNSSSSTTSVKRWPLTYVEDENMTERPAVAVKIENSVDARPQTGLEYADIVWEEVVEGGITRFMAVYNSQETDNIEPVRSVRPMDAAMAAPLKGMLAYSGGQSQFIQMVNDAGIQSLTPDSNSSLFGRDSSKVAPHNQTFNLTEAYKAGDDSHNSSPEAQFSYADSDDNISSVKDGKDATEVTDTFSYSSVTGWKYNSDTKLYERYQDGDKFVSSTGKQITAKNVISLDVSTQDSGATDPAGNAVPETILNNSSGTGRVFVNGKVIECKWSKGSATDPIKLTYETKDDSGNTTTNDVLLSAGNTFIDLVPTNAGGSGTYK